MPHRSHRVGPSFPAGQAAERMMRAGMSVIPLFPAGQAAERTGFLR